MRFFAACLTNQEKSRLDHVAASPHFSMICAGTPRLPGDQRPSCYETGDDRSGFLTDLPGESGMAMPRLSIVAGDTCGGNGAFIMAGSLSTVSVREAD